MFTKISLHYLQRALQVAAVLLVVGLPLGLFVGGAQPVAVGLVPAPWDKLVHAAVFAVLAGAMGYATGMRGRPMLVLAFCGALTVGALDELHQMSLSGRSAGWDDLVADAIGAALGSATLLWRERLKCWLLK